MVLFIEPDLSYNMGGSAGKPCTSYALCMIMVIIGYSMAFIPIYVKCMCVFSLCVNDMGHVICRHMDGAYILLSSSFSVHDMRSPPPLAFHCKHMTYVGNGACHPSQCKAAKCCIVVAVIFVAKSELNSSLCLYSV